MVTRCLVSHKKTDTNTDATFPEWSEALRLFATALTPSDLARILESPARVSPALRAIHSSAAGGGLPERVEGIAAQAWGRLLEQCVVPKVEVSARRISTDGTRKLLLDFEGAAVETVIIPGADRTTVCVSSQSGCTRSCRFCATAKIGFERNLAAGEIVMQFLVAARESSLAGIEAPSNVVFMGMGEPLDNLEEVVRAVDVLTACPLPGLAPRRVTVSTSGVLPAIAPFLSRSPAELALSLHGTTDEMRTALVPHNRSWPILPLLNEIRGALTGDNRILFVEYLLLGGVNDSDEDAHRLAELLEGLACRVNLIPFNPVEGLPFSEPKSERVEGFSSILSRAGVRTLCRAPRGRDVAAACGQLAVRRRRT